MKLPEGHPERTLPGAKCDRCRKRKRRIGYDPYCSYHCQEMANMAHNLAMIQRRFGTDPQR